MTTPIASSNTPNRAELAFLSVEAKALEPRATYLPNPPTRHRSFVRSPQNPPKPQNSVAELVADIDGVPVLVRFLVTGMAAEVHSDLVSKDADLHSLLSSTFKKMVDRLGGCADPSKQALAEVELISGGEHLARLPALSNDTVLRVGPLELDLLERTARRGDRRIDLRPREFLLLQYMMQRSGELLTRATLLKESSAHRCSLMRAIAMLGQARGGLFLGRRNRQ
jgi:hypothetical protein